MDEEDIILVQERSSRIGKMQDIKQLYERLRQMPFPTLGKEVGDFPLYDSLLAGYAERVSQGQQVNPSEVPLPDEETVKYVRELGARKTLSATERAFLEYFELLEQIQLALQKEERRSK